MPDVESARKAGSLSRPPLLLISNLRRFFRRGLLLKLGILLAGLPLIVNALWILPVAKLHPPVPGYSYAVEPRITSWSEPRLTRRPDETLLDFAGRLTMVVHHATYHCEADRIGQSWWTSLVNALGLLEAEQGLLSLESFHCGFCHARALILATALRKGGISDANDYGLYGHVVTTFHIDGVRYAADPDFGVLPFALPEDPVSIRKIVEKTYSRIVGKHGIRAVILLSDIFASVENNQLYSYEYLTNIRDNQDKILAWQRPIEISCSLFGLTLIGLHFGLKRRRRRAAENRSLVGAIPRE